MAKFSEIIEFLDKTLEKDLYNDSSINGLQVDAGTQSISLIGYAVDSGLSIIEAAVAKKCDLLLVHHGIFWKEHLNPLTGALGAKVKKLYQHHCSLYASHLPLDGHATLGNGAQIGKLLGLSHIQPYLLYKGSYIGACGSFTSNTTLSSIEEKLLHLPGASQALTLPFGKTSDIKTVAIITGSGAFAIEQAAKDGIDLLISGEPKQQAYHEAKELGLNVIFAGHYATETVGVKAAAELVAAKFGLQSVFIDEPTGI